MARAHLSSSYACHVVVMQTHGIKSENITLPPPDSYKAVRYSLLGENGRADAEFFP